MSTLEPQKIETRGGQRVGAGRKKRDQKEKIIIENIKVRKSTQMKAQAIRDMTGKKIISIIEDLINAEYLRVCQLNNIKPGQFPNTEQEISEYNQKIQANLEGL